MHSYRVALRRHVTTSHNNYLSYTKSIAPCGPFLSRHSVNLTGKSNESIENSFSLITYSCWRSYFDSANHTSTATAALVNGSSSKCLWKPVELSLVLAEVVGTAISTMASQARHQPSIRRRPAAGGNDKIGWSHFAIDGRAALPHLPVDDVYEWIVFLSLCVEHWLGRCGLSDCLHGC